MAEFKLIQSVSVMPVTATGNQSFEEAGKSPLAWRFNAFRLKQASGLLVPEQNYALQAVQAHLAGDQNVAQSAIKSMSRYSYVDIVSLMLLGMSLENLIKGLIVAANPSVFSSSGLERDLATHDLKELATQLQKHASISLSSAEIDAMHPLLTELVFWAGRYPTPRRSPDMQQRLDHNSTTAATLENLWIKLDSLLSAHCPPP